jgi:sulfur-carrier protein
VSVKVQVTGSMQKAIGGQKSIAADGNTVRAVIDDVEKQHPGFADLVVGDGEIHRFVNVYLNDEDVRFLGKLDTQIKDGDVLSVLPALAGG